MFVALLAKHYLLKIKEVQNCVQETNFETFEEINLI